MWHLGAILFTKNPLFVCVRICNFQLEKLRKLPRKKHWNLFSYKMSCGILQKLPLLVSFTKVLWWDLPYPLQCNSNFLLYGSYYCTWSLEQLDL